MSSNLFCCDLAKYACGLLAIVASIGIVIGCSSQPATSGENAMDTPEYPTAVLTLEKLYNVINEGGGDGSNPAVHGAMHSVGGVLQKLATTTPSLGKNAEKAGEAISRMSELYGNLDKAHHGNGDATYDDMSAELKELMDKLTSYSP